MDKIKKIHYNNNINFYYYIILEFADMIILLDIIKYI